MFAPCDAVILALRDALLAQSKYASDSYASDEQRRVLLAKANDRYIKSLESVVKAQQGEIDIYKKVLEKNRKVLSK